MKKALLLFIITSSVLFGQNFRKVKVHLSHQNDIHSLASAGIPVEESFFNKKDKTLTLFVSDDEFTKINRLSLRTEILIENWREYYLKRNKSSNAELRKQIDLSREQNNVTQFGLGSLGGFYTVEEVYNKLDSMKLKFPSIITQKWQIGTTVEGRPIYAVRISDNADADEAEPEVFYNAMIHAREPQGMMVLMYFMYYLLENYNVDPAVTYLVNNRELYFVPVINVDGYELNRITSPEGGGMHRTNKNGVDLNRNFGHYWGYDDVGSSPDSGSLTYRGPSAFSEPETKAIRDFCNSRHFVNALNYHTFSNLLIFPWGYINEESPDSLVFRDFASDMTEYNGYAWGTAGDLLYVTNGDADDWMYGEQSVKQKIFSFTPEVGGDMDGFWPQQNRILPLARENLYPNLYLAWTAGAYVKLADFRLNKEYINPGETIEITPVLRNKGLEVSQNFTVELIPITKNASVSNALTFSGLKSRNTILSEVPFYVHIFSNTSVQDDIKLQLNVKFDNLQVSTDTISLRVGSPETIFKDTTTIVSSFWNTNTWSLTNSDYHTAPMSYTDSRNGVYENNAEAYMITKNSIDLTWHNNPLLTFYTRYDIEKGWDYAQVKVSTDNGLNWKALKGKYTRTGSQSQVQEPLYDGKQESWVKEEMDLSAYAGSKIKLRFDLRSDAWEQRDGWYVDDISIVYYAVLPVELSAFTLTPEKNKVKLSWVTVSELNNKGFTIQRSKDQVNWTEIAFIHGHGTTLTENRYFYYDISPLNGKSYYRLVQIDYDGTRNVLKTGEINAAGIFDYSLSQNYPNPFNPETMISYTLAEAGFVSLKIYDVTGREAAVLVNTYQEAGRYESVLDAGKAGLSSGTYIYSLKVNSFISHMKLLIIK